MFDALNRWVSNLGRPTDRWRVTASIVAGTGDPNAQLIGNTTVEFINGTANFSTLAVTHSGNGYRLRFNVTYPATVNFIADSNTFDIKERVLYFTLLNQPGGANETVPFAQQPKVEVRDRANGELVDNTGWKGRAWLFMAELIRNGNSNANLNGSTSIQFIGGIAHFTNLSIDTPGKGFQLRLSTMTSPSSQYTAEFISDAFDVQERELYLRIAQQPGNCNDTVVCGNQPILEIRSRYPSALAGNLGWKGGEWFINASMYSGGPNSVLNGTSYFKIPKSGLIQFTDLNFYDVASGYRLLFTVLVKPPNPRFANMSLVSDPFDVKQRSFYLAVKVPVTNANDSVIFGQQPEIEVRDVGTNRAAKPLKRQWNVTVTISNNPNSGVLSGTNAIAVIGEVARFTDLKITGYGVGYTLLFVSNYGHQVMSQPFNVRFKNDYRPVFDAAIPSSINVYENETIPKTLYTFLATDQDAGIAGDVKYTIKNNEFSWLFDLASSSGVFKLKSSLDRENVSSYSLTIRASDSAPSPFEWTADKALKINVLDVNDNKPKYDWPVLNITVPETVLVGQDAFNVTTTDADDGENGRLTYKLLASNGTWKFSLNSNSGVFKAVSSLDLDLNKMPEPVYYFSINVHDNGIYGQQSVNITVYVRIVRVNEFTPMFSKSQVAVSLAENTAVGTNVFVVNASDLDSGLDGNVSYHLTSGNTGNVFGLSNGVLEVAQALDYETQKIFSLVVEARDQPVYGTPKTALLTVAVTVTDVNDNAPVLTLASNTLIIPENSGIGSTAVTITATDADSGTNGQLEYYMTANSSSLFTLDKNTGALITMRSLDLDSRKLRSMEETMTVFVTDKGSPTALNISVNLTLRIVAVNEYYPVLKHPAEITMLLGVNVQVGETVIQINATDDDYDVDGLVHFAISDGNSNGVFSINQTTGIVTLTKIPTAQFYALDIVVSDQAAVASRKSVNMRVIFLNMRSSTGTGSGGVYVGSVRGSVPLVVSSGVRITVPVHINVGTQDLEGFDVTVTYDTSIMRYESISTEFISIPSTGSIRILGLVAPNKTTIGIPKIADITFFGLLSMPTTAASRDIIIVDKNAEEIPRLSVKPTLCGRTTLGDANLDCVVNIRDAAFIQMYARESLSGFTSTVGQRLQNEVSAAQKAMLDTDKNGVVDYDDATMTRDTLVGDSAFIVNVSLNNPSAPDCKLSISAALANKDGTAPSNVQVFFILSYSSNALNTELTNSGLSGVTSYSIGGAVFGRVLKLNSVGSGVYKIESAKPKLTKNAVGMTLVIAVTTSANQIKVTDTSKKPSNIAGNKVSVDFGSGIKTDVFQSYAPQSLVNFTVPNSICQNPTVTKRFQLRFDVSFNTIRGKEAAFIASFKTFFENKYSKPGREVILANITVTEGSILVDFDVTVLASQDKTIVSDVVDDVKSGFTFTFDGASMTAAQTLKVDGKENIPPPQPITDDKKTLTIIIVVVVVVILIFVAVVLFIWYRKRKQRGKKVIAFEMQSKKKSAIKMTSYVHSTDQIDDIDKSCKFHKGEFQEIVFADVSTNRNSVELNETSFDNPAYQSHNEIETPRKSSPQAHLKEPLLEEISKEENVAATSIAFGRAGLRPSSAKNASKERTYNIPKRPSSADPVGAANLKVDRLTVDKSTLSLSQSSDGFAALSGSMLLQDEDVDESPPNVPTPDSAAYAEEGDNAVYMTLEVKQLREEEGHRTMHHVCEATANINGTLTDLRSTLSKFPFLARQQFVFLTSKFESIKPSKETNIVVNRLFKNVIKIKTLHGTDCYELFCPCGKVATFTCPVCSARGYCSSFCQEEDLIEHTKVCTKGNKMQKQRDAGKRMSRITRNAHPNVFMNGQEQ